MRTIKTSNQKVITNEQIDKITQLIETGLFQGTSYDQDQSLFEFGFVYDSKTETAILTRKKYMWDEMKAPLTYSVGNVPMSFIHEEFQNHKEAILEMRGCSEEVWLEMCDAYKIFDIEEFNLSVTKLLPSREMSFDDLVEYLNQYLRTYYSEIINT